MFNNMHRIDRKYHIRKGVGGLEEDVVIVRPSNHLWVCGTHLPTVKCEVRKHAASVKLVYLYSSLQIKAKIHSLVSIVKVFDRLFIIFYVVRNK